MNRLRQALAAALLMVQDKSSSVSEAWAGGA